MKEPVKTRKKLIEVALPLEAINLASAREKSIRHGHPSTLHLWWARRPLAAARAVIFGQMVDDPSSHPELFPTEKAQAKERKRLFKIIEDLVQWESTTNEEVLERARAEIWQSWRSTCADNADHPLAKQLFDRHKLPGLHDPFAGGGAIPLEAQRLGLRSYASDLNPVAVLINKAMIEIPPKFAGREPLNPEWQRRSPQEKAIRHWHGAQGLAEDVRYYGKWMRDEAEKRIGHLYPPVAITSEMTSIRPDLKSYEGKTLKVIAWIWARTVKSPNPAFANIDVPLASSFMLSTKTGKEAYIEPILHDDGYSFNVRMGKPKDLEKTAKGTKSGGSHSAFTCLLSGVAIPFTYIRSESKEGRMDTRLMAVVAEGDRGRVFLSPNVDLEKIAKNVEPAWSPDVEISHWPGRTNVVEYGLTKFSDLFTRRQMTALTTFSVLVSEARERMVKDAEAIGRAELGEGLNKSGTGTRAYSEAVVVYLAVALSRLTDICNALCRWEVTKTQVRNLFGRQAIPMLWDFAENNVFGDAAGDYLVSLSNMVRALETLPSQGFGMAMQADAQTQDLSIDKVISTDPPYYDNIGYADLSDFFYVWLRKSLQSIFPSLLATVAVPKAEELVAKPYRHGGKDEAEAFFLLGMTHAMETLAKKANPAFPVSIYYAFKQSENEDGSGTASTGWETFLDAVVRAGFSLTGTWPIRTELGNRMIGSGANALASSIVLICRRNDQAAPVATRRDFLNALKSELPAALANLQRGNIAPVDLAQASIGPGMAVYTRYSKVIDAEGNPLTVRQALAMINDALDEILAEQEGDFDSDTRWALTWFDQFSFLEGEYGVAETLANARNTSVEGMKIAGILTSKSGRVRLLKPEELPVDWDPTTDVRLTAWEIVHQLVRTLSIGEAAAAELVAKLGPKAEVGRELAYRLYNICERRKRSQDALAYNGLVQSWPEILRLARQNASATTTETQSALFTEKA